MSSTSSAASGSITPAVHDPIKSLKRSISIPVLTEGMAADQTQYITWRNTTNMILTSLELNETMALRVAEDHEHFPMQMLGKSLIYNAVKDVKMAIGVFGKDVFEVPNGEAVLRELDKVFGLQTSIAGRLLAQQRYELFSLVQGESVDQLAIRWFRTLSEMQVQLKSVPSVELQIGKLLVLLQSHQDQAVRSRVHQFMREADTVISLDTCQKLFDHLRNAEFQGRVFGQQERNVAGANNIKKQGQHQKGQPPSV
jgi:hypothetical protein